MKIQGEHYFQAPRDQVWEAVLDPRVLSSGLPGLHRLDTIGDHEYEGAVEFKVGSVPADFQGTLKLSDLKPPASYRFSLSGMGAAGFVDGDGLLILEESGGGTRIHYDLDVRVGGRIAGVGQGLLDSSAKAMAQQTLEGLEQQFPQTTPVTAVTQREAAPSPFKTAAVPGPPSRAKRALASVEGLAGKIETPVKRIAVVGVALIGYTIVVILLTRACSG